MKMLSYGALLNYLDIQKKTMQNYVLREMLWQAIT